MKSCPECAEDVHWPAVEVCYDCGHRFDGLLSFAHANVKARALILVLTFATLASYGAYRVSGADATDEQQRIECIESDLSHRSDPCK
jgi:hypothetical protein